MPMDFDVPRSPLLSDVVTAPRAVPGPAEAMTSLPWGAMEVGTGRPRGQGHHPPTSPHHSGLLPRTKNPSGWVFLSCILMTRSSPSRLPGDTGLSGSQASNPPTTHLLPDGVIYCTRRPQHHPVSWG